VIEAKGDLWTYPAAWRIITTNGVVKGNGEAVMGAGCALAAKQRFPYLPKQLGNALERYGNHLFIFGQYSIITFPTKNEWRDSSDLGLIEHSTEELLDCLMNRTMTKNTAENVHVMPRPGCGYGGLRWEVNAGV